MKKLIITGDDFGIAEPVNEAIIEAHRRGALTSASLIVGTKFTQDAVARAHETPSLKVGLHIVLVEGTSVLPPAAIPNLVGRNGEFSSKLVKTGFKYFFHPRIRPQLEKEIRAQFRAFQDTGLPLDHVNAHNHMHLHPTILAMIVKVGREFGMKAIRLPYEPPILSWKASGRHFSSKVLSAAFLYPWLAIMKQKLHRSGIRHNDRLFGMADSGAMTLDLTLRFLQNLPRGTTELHFHPATRHSEETDATMPDYAHEEEYRTLTSRQMLSAIQNADIQIISFSDLE